MTPKEAKLILSDKGLDSMIEACEHPPEDDCVEYLVAVGAALRSLKRLVKKIAKSKK
jgi:hypothetical protein